MLKILAKEIGLKKEIESIYIRKEELKLPLLAEDSVVYTENCQELTQKPLVSEFSKVSMFSKDTG